MKSNNARGNWPLEIVVGPVILEFSSTLRGELPFKLSKFKRTLEVIAKSLSNYAYSSGKLKRSQNPELLVNIELCGQSKVKRINEKYRNKNKSTDVLSFPVHASLEEIINDNIMGPVELGDIIICQEKTLAQAKEFGISWEQEFIHLLIHGFLHLTGLDHEISEADAKEMFALEAKLVKKIYNELY